MKKVFSLLLFTLLLSCEEVIDIELSSEEPRLVIDALIGYNDNNGDPLTVGQVRLTLTAPFFAEEVPVAENATVRIINESSGEVHTLVQGRPGIFAIGFPNLEFGVAYTLEVIYEGETYIATEQLVKAGTITSVAQGDGFLFDEEEETEIIVTFDDIPNERNHYLFAFDFDNYLVTDDEFYQDSNLTFSYFYEDIEPGDLLTITLLGINKRFADYIDLALIQSGDDSGGPFQVPTGTVRGNLVNVTNPDNYPFGYFSISEFDVKLITIE